MKSQVEQELAGLRDDADLEQQLAQQVLELAKAQLLRDAGFLAPAVGQLQAVPARLDCQLATDGSNLFYDQRRVLDAFAQAGAMPTRHLLHVLLHCVFTHPLQPALPSGRLNEADKRLWDIACDVAVCDVAAHMGDDHQPSAQAVDRIRASLGAPLNAQRVFAWLQDASSHDGLDLQQLERDVHVDDHSRWGGRSADDGGAGYDGARRGKAATGSDGAAQSLGTGGDVADQAALHAWRQIAQLVGADANRARIDPSSAIAGVSAAPAPCSNRVDYRDFLLQFASRGETLHLSDDEFDTGFYTFGLQRYGNLALIEPLEFRDEKRIREFAVVIDTSGSVMGQAVRTFVQTTYDVLSSQDDFFDHVNVHIIQCDAQVRSDDVIRNTNDLERWSREMHLTGFGGTDFRPAFDYVDQLVAQGQFENLGGLIYFTDGFGAYPEHMPPYKVAFVFYDDGYRAEDVPVWAVQAVIGDEL